METIHVARMKSPVGTIAVASSSRGAAAIELDGDGARFRGHLARWWRGAEVREDTRPNRALLAQLQAYFAGERKRFTIAVDLRGTEYQKAVWEEMRRIRYGEVRSYGEVARAIGRPRGPRAVGTACHGNPLPLIVPCHRVIAGDGTLGGFGGRLDLKTWLLELEGLPAARWRGARPRGHPGAVARRP